MDTKLLLVKAITLLYLQGILGQTNTNTSELIERLLDHIKNASETISTDFGHDVISRLRETLVWMDSQPNGHVYDTDALKQRFIIDTQGEAYVHEALVSMFDFEGKEEEYILKYSRSQEFEIRNHLNKIKAAQVLKDFYIKAQFKSDTLDWGTMMNELDKELSPYVNSSGGNSAYNHPSIVATVDFGDASTVATALQKSKDELSVTGVIKTPFKGLNRMLGPHGGLRRGEYAVVPALQHMYKTGMMLDIFAGVGMLNTPYMVDPTKKPMNLRISFENKTQTDMVTLYERLWELEYNVRSDTANVSVEEATKYVMDKLSVNGYHNRIIHIDPSDYSYLDLFELIERIEEDGYEIHICTIDYLNMMSKRGCNQGPAGEEIRDLFRRTRNYFSKKNITVVTPHQLSTESKNLQRNGQNNFVQEVAGKGYYDGCKRIDQEVDLEIYLHIVDLNGERYLTIARGKHRGVRIGSAADLYTVYKFNPDIGLPWDVDAVDQSRNSVGGETMADGGASAWFDAVA